MSILIKGMEMPKSCGYCKFKYRTMEGDECMFDVAYTTYQSRPKDCPIVPVPPHGRLIDADAFSAKIIGIIAQQNYDDFYAQSLSVGEILREVVNELKGEGLDGFDNAPTIIPAEEEGE